jgi:hypothetical protein
MSSSDNPERNSLNLKNGEYIKSWIEEKKIRKLKRKMKEKQKKK